MKPNAVIVNIGRGAIIDEQALVRALKEGWIAGAALDVFQQEPLSGESELWGLDNVILTPHISGGTPRYMERAVALFCDNLRRYLAGEPLRNVVDPARGELGRSATTDIFPSRYLASLHRRDPHLRPGPIQPTRASGTLITRRRGFGRPPIK